MSNPTIGRIVIYVDHSGNEFPAIVIPSYRPWDTRPVLDDEVCLRIFNQRSDQSASNVKQDELPSPDKILLHERTEYLKNTWHWPVRVET